MNNKTLYNVRILKIAYLNMWYIIRHGQTLENNLGIQQGQNQSLLTLKGITQAQSIGYRLLEQNEDFSNYKFISSPLVRARHTLQIITEILGLTDKKQLIVEPLIINRNKGIFQGIYKKEVENKFPEEYKKREENPWTYEAPNGGESKNSSYLRVKEFVDKYKQEENLIIVGHRNINKMLGQILSDATLEEIKNTPNDNNKSQNYFFAWDGNKINKI